MVTATVERPNLDGGGGGGRKRGGGGEERDCERRGRGQTEGAGEEEEEEEAGRRKEGGEGGGRGPEGGGAGCVGPRAERVPTGSRGMTGASWAAFLPARRAGVTELAQTCCRARGLRLTRGERLEKYRQWPPSWARSN